MLFLDGITALVEFVRSDEAKCAFKTLAYARFGTTPLYLEWAPGDVFIAESIAQAEAQLAKEAKRATDEKDEDKEEVRIRDLG